MIGTAKEKKQGWGGALREITKRNKVLWDIFYPFANGYKTKTILSYYLSQVAPLACLGGVLGAGAALSLGLSFGLPAALGAAAVYVWGVCREDKGMAWGASRRIAGAFRKKMVKTACLYAGLGMVFGAAASFGLAYEQICQPSLLKAAVLGGVGLSALSLRSKGLAKGLAWTCGVASYLYATGAYELWSESQRLPWWSNPFHTPLQAPLHALAGSVGFSIKAGMVLSLVGIVGFGVLSALVGPVGGAYEASRKARKIEEAQRRKEGKAWDRRTALFKQTRDHNAF